MTKSVDKVREVAVQEYSATPSKNPRYRGATPEVGRTLLKRQPVTPPEEVAEERPGLKSGL